MEQKIEQLYFYVWQIGPNYTIIDEKLKIVWVLLNVGMICYVIIAILAKMMMWHIISSSYQHKTLSNCVACMPHHHFCNVRYQPILRSVKAQRIETSFSMGSDWVLALLYFDSFIGLRLKFYADFSVAGFSSRRQW